MKNIQNRRSKYNNIPLGLALGLFLPIIIFILIWAYNTGGDIPLTEYYNTHKEASVHTNIISLCTIPNLLLFYIFLQKNRYYTVRGVILSVFIIVFWVIFTKWL